MGRDKARGSPEETEITGSEIQGLNLRADALDLWVSVEVSACFVLSFAM
jgi:hypothetical protein